MYFGGILIILEITSYTIGKYFATELYLQPQDPFFKRFILLYLHWCFAYNYMCGGVSSPDTGVTDGCELLFGYWELNPDPLEEQPMAPNC